MSINRQPSNREHNSETQMLDTRLTMQRDYIAMTSRKSDPQQTISRNERIGIQKTNLAIILDISRN